MYSSITEKIQKVNIYACENTIFSRNLKKRKIWTKLENLLTFCGKSSKIILFIFAGNVELKMGFFKRPHVRVFFGGIRSRCLALVKYWPICSAPIIRLWQLKSRHKNRKIEEFCAEKKDRSSYVPTWANSSSVNRIGHPGQR